MLVKHRHIKGLYVLLGLVVILIITQCVSEYDPNLDFNDNLLVVNGSIIRGNDQQTIVLSRSTSINSNAFTAVRDCNVYVTDDNNNIFRFVEKSPGTYHAEIESMYLAIGTKFKLTIETPNDQVYESGYEEISDCPPIDSLYFVNETRTYGVFQGNQNGIRLNVDVYANDEYNGYYRWEVHETYETRSKNDRIDSMLVGVKDEYITLYRFDSVNWYYVPDKAVPIAEFITLNQPDTFYICYHDYKLNEAYYSSVSNIVNNSKKRVPLHFVPVGPRLSFRYSCLVSQYSLSEGAYNYWQTKLTEIEESGGLYTTQPGQSTSNIKNINNNQETVLGYFWVSAFQQKRIFFQGPYVGNLDYCDSRPFDIEDYYEQVPNDTFGTFQIIDSMENFFPVYMIDHLTYPPRCFDCRYSGGTLTKPDFW